MSPTTHAGELQVGRGWGMSCTPPPPLGLASWGSAVAMHPSGLHSVHCSPGCVYLSLDLSKGPFPALLAALASPSLPGCCIRGSGVTAEPGNREHPLCFAVLCCAPRYTMVAQELVVRSRGVLKERGWRLANDKLGSGDDISVFVIPLGGPGNYT